MFNHGLKIRAIGSLCERVADDGFCNITRKIESGGVEFLRTFPFIGPTTSYHFAKNIGLDVVKPDRHLLRLCKAAGFSSPNEMCQAISAITGDRLAVIDIVLWRYATVTSDYTRRFAVGHLFQAEPDMLRLTAGAFPRRSGSAVHEVLNQRPRTNTNHTAPAVIATIFAAKKKLRSL